MNYLKKELYDLVKTDNRIFDFIQQSSLDGLWYWDLENQEQEWMNESFWETLGYDPAEMPHLASAWQNIIHPDDLAAAIEKVGQHIADPTVPYDQIVRYTHKNGSTVYIRCRGLAIRDENGVAKRLMGAHVDITEAKQREVLLEEVNRVARIGAWELDLINNTVWWSDTTREIHGVAKDYMPSLDTGINFYKEGESRDTITRLINLAINDGTSFDQELQIVTITGKEVWVRAIGQADRINDKTHRLYGVFLDIDERKRSENQLLNYNILEAKAKEMEQFAYAASHDLREPLLTIKGYLEVLEEDHGQELSAEGIAHLNVIKGAAERMDKLIHGMLDYSRLSQLKQLQEIDLNQIVNDLCTDLGASIENCSAELKYDNLPTVKAYPLELKVMLQNLVSNSLKFIHPDRKPLVRIEAVVLQNASYQIKVIDNGIGIAKKDHARVFDLFRRLHARDKYDGMGIGLANVKKIIELHNGTIGVESNPAGGTTFIATLQP